jgi:hypothetical protein
MANNDWWRIYGNTIANDRGEMIFELGDNAQASSTNGQRFRFFYNNVADGTAKSPFILDYNDAVFNTNASFTGNVGIGTTSPATKLQIEGTGVGAWLTINRTDSGSNIVDFTQSGTRLGYVGYIGNDLLINNATNSNTILYSNNLERMRITSSGNVGIGTSSPSSRLHVENGNILTRSAALSTSIIAQSNQNTDYKAELVCNWDNNCLLLRAGKDYKVLETEGFSMPDTLKLFTSNTERMRITSGGNVGIGTTSPTSKATINGTLQITGSSTPSGGTGLELLYDGTAAGTLAFSRGVGYIPNFMDGSQLQFYTSSTERMRITSGGNVGIGTTSGSARLNVQDSNAFATNLTVSDAIGNGIFARFNTSVTSNIGSITRVGSTPVVAYNTTSDYRLKEDFKQIKGLELISKIKVYDFKWKGIDDRMDGVIAHELQEVIPYAVTGEKDGENMQSVDYSKLVPILIQSIQELKAEIEILKNK